MIRAAVLGSPVSHSLSPLLHNSAYEFLGIEGRYEHIEVKNFELESFMRQALADGWSGFSLTMPLKETVVSLANRVDSRAARISSANTLIIESGEYFAFSSDLLAFERILEKGHFKSVAVIGGGGTARAAIGAIDGRVNEIDVLVRDDKRRSSLEACVQISRVNLCEFDSSISEYDLVISTVPAGASDELADACQNPSGTLFEVLYHPWPTRLSSKWETAGMPVFSGFDLLVEQALDQIQAMLRIEIDYAALRSHLFSALAQNLTR